MNKKTKEEFSCGLILLHELKSKLQVLLVEAHHGGIGFPKGHVEAGETFLDTALRESYEEVGVIPDCVLEDPYFTETYLIQRPHEYIKKTVYYFLASTSDKIVSVQESELKSAEWVSVDKAFKKINHQSTRDILQQAFDFLGISVGG